MEELPFKMRHCCPVLCHPNRDAIIYSLRALCLCGSIFALHPLRSLRALRFNYLFANRHLPRPHIERQMVEAVDIQQAHLVRVFRHEVNARDSGVVVGIKYPARRIGQLVQQRLEQAV